MIAAECFFLDVGQGACQVLCLADGSVIIIDCGRSAAPLLALLGQLDVDRIALLLLTHNDIDHVGGAPELIAAYSRAIDRFGMVQDRAASKLEDLRIYDLLRSEVARGHLPEPTPLLRSPSNWILYRSPDVPPYDLRLDLLFPGFFENVEAQASGQPNASSAVLLLRFGSRRILFPGDAEVGTWNAIRNRQQGPIICDVLAISHHGGQIVRPRRGEESEDDFHAALRPTFDRLYSDAIRCQYAIISVGTGNTYDHPFPPHVESLRDAGVHVMCTQITRRCCLAQEPLRPGIIPPRWPGQAEARESRTDGGRSRNVACAGTVLVQIGPDEVIVDRWQEHQQAIDRKLSRPAGHPLCRR